MAKSGALERPGNINLHYPPLVIHFLIAPKTAQPRTCYQRNLSRGAPKFVVHAPKQAAGALAQASIAPITALLDASTPHCSRNLAIWSAWHLPAVRGSTRVHTTIPI